MEILDVGCGAARDKKATVGIDTKSYAGVDIVHNLNVTPWPIESNRFDRALCLDVIEHLDDIIKTMEELHRVLKTKGIIEILTPHFSHPNSYHDPTHKHHFTFGSFDYFTGERAYPRYTACKFNMAKKELVFDGHEIMGRLLARISTRHYEKHYSRIFPPRAMRFEIEVEK